MPGRRFQHQMPDGKVVEAEPVDIQSSQEPFNIYMLEDGTTVKMKAVVTDVIRIIGAVSQDGEPVYFIKSNNVVSVRASEETKRKAQKGE